MISVRAFDPIKILTCWALQNDYQILSFVKAINVDGKKWPEILVKWPIPTFVLFILKQSLEGLLKKNVCSTVKPKFSEDYSFHMETIMPKDKTIRDRSIMLSKVSTLYFIFHSIYRFQPEIVFYSTSELF